MTDTPGTLVDNAFSGFFAGPLSRRGVYGRSAGHATHRGPPASLESTELTGPEEGWMIVLSMATLNSLSDGERVRSGVGRLINQSDDRAALQARGNRVAGGFWSVALGPVNRRRAGGPRSDSSVCVTCIVTAVPLLMCPSANVVSRFLNDHEWENGEGKVGSVNVLHSSDLLSTTSFP